MEGFVILNKVYITLVFAIVCFDWSNQDKVHIHIQPSVVQAFQENAIICSKETGVPASTMKQIVTEGLEPKDEATKKFLHCISYNTGFVEEDGHLILEKMISLQIMNGTVEDYANTVKECNKITLENYLETIKAMAACVHENYFYTY